MNTPAIKKQISYISPGQAAKVLIIVYLTLSMSVALLAALAIFIFEHQVDLTKLFSALLLNAVGGFILLWLGCHVYNWLAARFGGIEIHLSDVPEEA